MRYHVLACDYDGTLAHHGRVDEPTVASLERLLATGRKLVLVTGRELDELLGIFPEIQLFDHVVAENGALLYRPSDKQISVLAEPPPVEFADILKHRGVSPLARGRVIVATWRPHETVVLDTIRELGLDLQVIFNKDAVMILPASVNKASGLSAALAKMGMTPHEVVAVGDAENDHAFLAACECGVAVANALPALKTHADLVTDGDHGAGVAELVGHIVGDDLADLDARLVRHHLLVGTDPEGAEVKLSPYGHNLLIAGPSASGKSTVATSLLERLSEHRYQFCIIDPEGDYENLDGTVPIGSGSHGPTVDEALQTLAASTQSTVISLVGMPIADRPPFFLKLLPRLLEMRARTGRPHWLVLDEAHHLMPSSWQPDGLVLPNDMRRTVFITVHPDHMARAALGIVDRVVTVGKSPEETLQALCSALGEPRPSSAAPSLAEGEIYLWSRRTRTGQRVRLTPSQVQHRRHVRKYAEGTLSEERSFYFTGPKGKMRLRAQNLILFMQLADGIDDATWMHHLRQHDYSTWLREQIHDGDLADKVRTIESSKMSAADSKRQIRAAIEQQYTLPATGWLPVPGTEAATRPS